MAAEDAPAAGTAESAAAAAKPTESLSQFVARVLSQLSLSAWIPSAALVLLLDLTAELGAQLDAKRQGPLAALGNTFAKMSTISIGSAVLLVLAIVVLTMVTQAFSFQAIQVLEGYWGTRRPANWFGHRRCDKHRRTRGLLTESQKELTKAAWRGAEEHLEREQEARVERGQPVLFTPDMVAVIKARVLDRRVTVSLRPKEDKVASAFVEVWEWHAPAELLRRRANVDRRLADYPSDERMLPTRLGNILRAHEDLIRRIRIRSFVQELFADLPPTMQAEHDEQRTRLDLYCSMVFVLGSAGLIAVARFAAHHWPYALFSATVTVAGMRIMYGAALATARAYGNLLLTIRDYAAANSPRAPSA
ncbi:MAG: hypothetical protein LBV34_15050 [Nocardiopsaceae bacterium]|jgi:hypothetical protein|nr:hypothetical protein [Nocardiopsaceae bacterium]